MDKSADPSTPSLAYDLLADNWAMIRTIRQGAKAIRASGEKYLIKFPAEEQDEYERRKKSAPWRPEFVDALSTLSAKPFTKQVTLAEGSAPDMVSLAEDIDGRGNNLHVFAKDIFEGGVAMGAQGILVDFPSGTGAKTKAEEVKSGVRPYWVPVNADDILSLVTEQRGADRIVSYLRIKESRIERKGFEEIRIPLIREIEPGAWRIWKEETDKAGQKIWVLDTQGVMTLDQVPFVFYATGDIEGDQYVKPPLLDVADMQIELYNSLSKKETSFTLAAHPMLTANGMAAPEDGSPVQTGPGRVLYAPSTAEIDASWAYLHPAAANMKEIRDDVSGIISDLRRLAMQPMVTQAANTPAVAFALDGEKSYTVLQSWALSLKDALEQAFVFTAMWTKSKGSEPSVMVHTDFAVGLYGETEVQTLLEARKEAQISQETYWDEMQRRGVLGPQFDRKEERKRLSVENPPFDPEKTLETTE